ncbi:MAG: tetratricopeptide repeat protein, partial [Bacteroides sp.]
MHIGKKNWSILLILSIVSHALPLQADNIKADSLIQKAKLVKYTNPKQSAYFAQQALELLPVKSPDTRRAQALLAYGVACKFLGDFDIGIKALYDALHYCKPEDYRILSDIQMQMANIYCRLKDYNKAFEINDKAATLCKIYQDSVGLAGTYNTRGIIHYSLNEFKTAEQCFRNALQINRKIGNIKAAAANLNNMCLYEGDIDEKLSLINEAIIINKNFNATWALAENYNNMGKQYFFAHQYDKALKALKEAKIAAATSNGKELICDNYEYSSWVYAAMKQYDKAYDCLLQLYTMSQELQNDKKLRDVEQEISRKKLMDQQRENELVEQSYEIELLRRNIFLLSATLLFCIVIAIFLPRWYRRRKNMQLIET